MDVRCEKCQTEYELDEARLKPGGVTVKCTNCGHMFKIRKRTTAAGGVPAVAPDRARTPSNKRADSLGMGDDTVVRTGEGGPSEERQWMIRLENGEQKSCRELALLQQWIVAGVVTRESLISRTGKTWKRIGDITELAQYFTIADEARVQRQQRTTDRPPTAGKPAQGTLLGIGTASGASAAGGTILPDDDDRSTGSFRARGKTTPPPPPAKASIKTPPMGSNATVDEAVTVPRPTTTPSVAEASPAVVAAAASAEPRTLRPPTQPPPPPRKAPSAAPQIPASNRSTGAWAADAVPGGLADATADKGPSGPQGGRLKVSSEPAFAGRIRVEPSDESGFNTGRVKSFDDDDDVLPERRGSRAGTLLVVLSLLVMGAAAGVIYMFVIKGDGGEQQVATPTPADDAGAVAVVGDAASIVTPVVDAVEAPATTVVDTARAVLGPDLELQLRDALKSLDGKTDAGVDAMRVHLASAIAQGLVDRAAITGDKAEADKLKKDAKQLALDVAGPAQKAHKAAPDDPAASLAMAHVLRLQGKAAKDIKRYLDAAKAKSTPDWKRDVALAEALVLVRDGKLDDARALLAPVDQGADALEQSGDVRARFQLARIAYAQNKPAEAKPLVDQILAAQPEHAGAKALAARIETTVAKTDPLPPEDPQPSGGSTTKPSGGGTPSGGGAEQGDSYDRLLAKANAAAERNCTQALDLYGKALEQKPNGVEALTGMGYCHIDAKQFASAFSKFRAALAVSPRYEPALWGVGEAYQQQGRKEQAIEAFKAYLEVYPGAAKAQKALERLGAGASETPPEQPTPQPQPQPQPQPTPPAPEPTPAPAEGGGAGAE